MIATLRKPRITPETLALYQRAREFFDSAIPVDPGSGSTASNPVAIPR
jgi:hypothetical protein